MELYTDENKISVKINNYEYLHAKYDDLNWVMASVRVIVPEGRWSFNAACLMAYDLPRWAKWFQDPSASELDTLTDYDFVLWFEYHGIKDGLFHLSAIFHNQGLPPWAKVKGERDYRVDFHVPAEQMYRAGKAFRIYAESFPPRYINPRARK